MKAECTVAMGRVPLEAKGFAVLVDMEQWSPHHRAFVVETLLETANL